MRFIAVVFGIMLLVSPAFATDVPPDPLRSPLWPGMARHYLPEGPITFDPRVRVNLVPLAENPATVPVSIDASGLDRVERIVVWADLSPIPLVLSYEPVAARPTLAFTFKVEQSTALRVAARTGDGVWHVGAAEVQATGGGCTMPARSHGEKDWVARLNEVRARVWRAAGDSRLRLHIRHPMDTGLAPGIPAFFLETLTITTPDGAPIGRLELHEPVSENPSLTFEPNVPDGVEQLRVQGRDNNGNEIDVTVPAPVRASALEGGRAG